MKKQLHLSTRMFQFAADSASESFFREHCGRIDEFNYDTEVLIITIRKSICAFHLGGNRGFATTKCKCEIYLGENSAHQNYIA